MKIILTVISFLLLATTAQANDKALSHAFNDASRDTSQDASKYAGEEARDIKSLSPDDIAELKRGGGWGLAKAAELNGMPGPAHLLQMQEKIPLSEKQVAMIGVIYAGMKTQAIRQGQTLIDLERQLENEFRNATITETKLRSLLDALAAARGALRYTHLATHLKTPEILSKKQISRYNQLRGYKTGGDPCANPPSGHDAKLWRKHNGCQ